MEDLLASTNYVCLGGAGLFAVGYVGFLGALHAQCPEALGAMVARLRGAVATSSGTVVALGMLCGLGYREMEQCCSTILRSNFAPSLDLQRFVHAYGGDDGKVLRAFIESVLAACGIAPGTTFRDFHRLTKRDFVCCATEVATGSPFFFRHAATPEVRLADAMFMSMSLPFIYAPAAHGERLMVDGVMSCNVPHGVFPLEETLVLFQSTAPRSTESLKHYIYALVSTSLMAQTREMDRRRREDPLFARRAICIGMPDAFKSLTVMTLEEDAYQVVYGAGYLAALQHFAPALEAAAAEVMRLVVGIRAARAGAGPRWQPAGDYSCAG